MSKAQTVRSHEPAAAALGHNRYGKHGIRLVTVRRDGERHELTDLAVDVQLTGDFAAAHVDGDNAQVLPTDTMRGTVYALARQAPVGALESFGRRLGERVLDSCPAATTAEVHLVEQPWERISAGGTPHPHAFTRAPHGQRTAQLTLDRDAVSVRAGVADLRVLKTTRSAFAGFLVDDYTTLAETDDRILATTITATWRYGDADVDFDACFLAVQRQLLAAFAEHDSQSVQHTAYHLGEQVLAAMPEVAEVSLTMPNQHHVLADLTPYGLDNPGDVFVVTDRPYGVIEATVTRR